MEIKTKKINLAEKFSKFQSIIKSFPKQFSQDVCKLSDFEKLKGPFSSIIICGVGGSAAAGDILKGWLNLEKRNHNIKVWRNYDLPYYADKTSLFVCISYSGNTEETLSSFEMARAIGAPIVCISSGGKLEVLSKTYHIPHVKIPTGIPPRSSAGYLLNSLIKILTQAKMLPNASIKIQKLQKDLNPMLYEKLAKKISKKITDGIPLIYSSAENKFIAHEIKTRLNENSKIHAFYNFVPELNHNEMVGFTFPQNRQNAKFFPIFLEDPSDHPKIKIRFITMKKLLKDKKYAFESVKMSGDNNLEKIFNWINFGDWLSFYIAKRKNIDPIAVDLIENFKKQLQ
jgi:glucose/mannose-6-phosphate isomerase